MTPAQRRELTGRQHRHLSLVRQCQLMGVSRSSLYYRPKGTPPGDLSLMQAMDRQYLETPSPGNPFLRFQADEGLAGPAGDDGKPEAGAATHETDGTAGYLPAASHQPTSGGTLGLSLPAEGSDDHPGEPGVGGRHHLPAHGPGVLVPGGHHGLAQPVRGGLGIVRHSGDRLLCRGPDRGPRPRPSAKEGPRYSTPAREASSPAASSRRYSRTAG